MHTHVFGTKVARDLSCPKYLTMVCGHNIILILIIFNVSLGICFKDTRTLLFLNYGILWGKVKKKKKMYDVDFLLLCTIKII